jgi:uncharacterized membrane protein
MATVTESVDVAVPIRTAYDQWTQFEASPRFMDHVVEVRQLSDAMTHWVVKEAGIKREFDARITEQLPDERVAWTSVEGPRQAGVVTFHRLDADHTRVTAQIEMQPDGIVEQTADRAGMVTRMVKGDMARFRDFIQARDAQTGAWRGQIDRPTP